MSTMAEAFKKVGMASEKDVERVKAEQRLTDLKKTDRFGSERGERPKEEVKATSAPESAFTKLFNDPKSQKFILHIVHAFTPFAKAHYVFDWELEGLRKKACDICRRQVISKCEAIAIYERHSKEWEKSENKSLLELLDSRKAFEGRKFATVSPESKTILCSPCHTEFSKWVVEELLHGNKLINRIMTKRVREQWGMDFSGRPLNTDALDFKKREEEALQNELRKHQIVDLGLQRKGPQFNPAK